MSKILTKSTKITEKTAPKKSAKFLVQRTQSSNTLSLLKAARVAPKACPNSIQQINLRVSKHHQSSPVAKEQLNIIYMKMLHQRKVAVIDAGGDEQKAEAILTKEAQQQQQKKQTVNNNEDKNDIKMAKKGHKNALAAKKWTSALRVVSAMTRFKNVPTKHREYEVGSRGSSFSTSNESTPSRTYAAEQPAADRKSVDPVYLALKQATAKYGSAESVDPVYLALKQATAKYGSAVGCCSGGESRRGSQSLTPTGTLFDATMLSARNMSQTSLYDSGNYSENELLSARSGSTPQLHGISPQMPTTDVSSTKGVHVQPQVLHIVTHEYVSGDCSLRPCDRLVVVDNGDPDWKHGFKLNDQLEHLITFPNSCVASYKPEEQPMRLLQSCNLSGQKLRLYRDQVVFAQPDSLSNDGKVLVRTEYDKFAKCPLQFLTMA
uniref:SH3 domain-containing protein n=1 Tax=Globodera pallida TaxID=36090 RepID=A0A183CDN6_GLOPA